MKWNALDRAIAIWVCLIGTCAVIFVCAGLSGLIFENSSNVASWVQAVGSIVAILSGFLVAERTVKKQHAQQMEKEHEERRIRERIQYYLIADRHDLCKQWGQTVLKGLQKEDLSRISELEILGKSVIDSLKSVPVDQFPSADVVLRSNLAGIAVASLMRVLNEISNEKSFDRVGVAAKRRAKRLIALNTVDEKYCIDQAEKISTAKEIDEFRNAEEIRTRETEEILKSL